MAQTMLSTRQVANILHDRLGVSYTSHYLSRLAARGEFPGAMRGSTSRYARWNIPESAVDDWIKRVQAASEPARQQ